MTDSAPPHQRSFDELGTPLQDVTFCVVDLETTGGSPRDCRVTEIGAVKIRAGEVVGELASLVDPGMQIPAAISSLTGITASMVAGRPPLEAVLPAFLEFSRGTALVAHNARFDTGFLNAGLRRLDYPALEHPVVCTAALARRLVRDEVRDCKLATLARHFRCATEPIHRALADARATVEVFHALLERAGGFGMVTLDDLMLFSRMRSSPLFAARRSLLDGLPSAPGVYLFRSASGEVLYVGKATDLRARVRSYFSSDDRRKIVDLLKEAATVDHIRCPTAVEAAAREVRLIRAHLPRFNRRGKPGRLVHVTLTDEAFPRLSIVRRPPAEGRPALGPLPGRRVATTIVDALHDATVIRRCTDRIGPRTTFTACALADMGRCPAPCERRADERTYARVTQPVTDALTADPTAVIAALERRMRSLAEHGRYEEAATARDRLSALVNALLRTRRERWISDCERLVAAGPARGRLAEVVLARRGIVTASRRCAITEIEETAAALLGEASSDHPIEGIEQAGDSDERDLLARWLERPGVRVLHVQGMLATPIAGGRQLAGALASLSNARRTTGEPSAELAAKRLRRDAEQRCVGSDRPDDLRPRASAT